jgi:hypothetical protein
VSDDQVLAIAARLESIAEELADLAIDRIRGTLRGEPDDTGSLLDERRVTRARRAVDKAVGLLRSVDRDAVDGD